MKKSLCIVLLLILVLLCCGCAAAKDAMSETPDLIVKDVKENAAYSQTDSTEEAAYSQDESAEDATSAQEETVEDGGTDVAKETPTEAVVLQEPLVYVSFTQETNVINADDGTKLFTGRIDVPEFVTEDQSVNDWLASGVADALAELAVNHEDIAQTARSIYENREEGSRGFYPYSYYSNVSTGRLDTAVISVLRVDSVYSGGAHPNYAQRAINVDLVDGEELELADVILPGGADVLHSHVLDQLTDRFGGLEQSGLYADYPEIVESYFDETELTSNWYFSENGLVIYFNCYEIAPYAAGIIKVEIPYELLDTVLEPAYFPQSSEAVPGEIIILDSIDGRTVLGAEPEGECLFIGTDQTVRDVKLHLLTGWVTDDVPIVGQMVFAANRLTSFDAIAVPAADDNGYVLTYNNGDGQTHNLVLDANGIREIVSETAE